MAATSQPLPSAPTPHVEHGAYTRGEAATSPLLPGFTADVAAVFDAPEAGA